MSTGAPRTRRLFFALWPGEAERRALAVAHHELIGRAGGRAVPAANLHLTLAFLGAVAETRLESLCALGAAVALPPTLLALDTLDWWRAVGALVALASGPPAEFLAVHATLRERLGAQGFATDARPFWPHVTLARRVTARPPLAAAPVVEWLLAELALVESLGSPGDSRYVPLARWPGGARRGEFRGF